MILASTGERGWLGSNEAVTAELGGEGRHDRAGEISDPRLGDAAFERIPRDAMHASAYGI